MSAIFLHAASAGFWDSRPLIALTLLVMGGLFARGWRRLRANSSGTASAFGGDRLFAYLSGLALLALALTSPIDTYADEYFSVHMIQHMLLVFAPLPLLWARPLPTSLWGLPASLRGEVGRWLRPGAGLRRALDALTSVWVALPLFSLALWIWHYPPLFQLALRNQTVHDLEHLTFFGASLVFWWPVLCAAPKAFVPYSARIIHVAAAFGQNALLGAIIMLADKVFYTVGPVPGPLSPLGDQQVGGMGMLLGISMVYIVAIPTLLYHGLTRRA